MNIKSRTNNADDLAWVHLIERRKQVELWQFSCLRQSYALELSPNIMEGVNPEGQLVMVQWSPSNDLQRVKITLNIHEVTDKAAVHHHFKLVPAGCESIIIDIWGILGLIHDEALRRFYLAVLLNNELMGQFFNARASRSHHHNHACGLLEHSHEVAVTAAMLCWRYNVGPLSVCVAFIGGLLHDIGKIHLFYNADTRDGIAGSHESYNFMVLAEPLALLYRNSPKIFEALSSCLSVKIGRRSEAYIPASMVRLCDNLSMEVCHWRTAFADVPPHHWYAHSAMNDQWYKRLG
ncbi:HDOD domain-containing protein [Shewanella sp. LC6]|uniref:HD domain-containing protein n=1 Tax=unclassified Shewanella TaxID=196818 RepID=UPI00112982CD|nr:MULTISPECIES: TraI domain-containing protein [unclassified Shewanella]QQK58080.1 HDOD domain-containing protein [Shewanella sp. LC6]TPE58127.1 HDOD domain-containing protein [Shewanella sp. LC2]